MLSLEGQRMRDEFRAAIPKVEIIKEITSLNYLVLPPTISLLRKTLIQFKHFHSEKAHNLKEQELEGERSIVCLRLRIYFSYNSSSFFIRLGRLLSSLY